MKKVKCVSAALLVWSLSVLISSDCLGQIYYDIDFSSPLHTVEQVPTIDDSPATPSQNRGEPIVVDSYGQFTDQPLLLNTLGNSPSFYYDSITLDMDRGRGFYYSSFDVLTHNLIGTDNNFTVLYDLPWVHNLSFINTGELNIFGRENVPFQDDTPMHFEVLMDIENDFAKVLLNGTLVYDDKLLIYLPNRNEEDFYFRSLRFSHGLQSSIGTPNYSTNIAIDNIIVTDYIVPEPATLLLLGIGGLFIRKR